MVYYSGVTSLKRYVADSSNLCSNVVQNGKSATVDKSISSNDFRSYSKE